MLPPRTIVWGQRDGQWWPGRLLTPGEDFDGSLLAGTDCDAMVSFYDDGDIAPVNTLDRSTVRPVDFYDGRPQAEVRRQRDARVLAAMDKARVDMNTGRAVALSRELMDIERQHDPEFLAELRERPPPPPPPVMMPDAAHAPPAGSVAAFAAAAAGGGGGGVHLRPSEMRAAQGLLAAVAPERRAVLQPFFDQGAQNAGAWAPPPPPRPRGGIGIRAANGRVDNPSSGSGPAAARADDGAAARQKRGPNVDKMREKQEAAERKRERDNVPPWQPQPQQHFAPPQLQFQDRPFGRFAPPAPHFDPPPPQHHHLSVRSAEPNFSSNRLAQFGLPTALGGRGGGAGPQAGGEGRAGSPPRLPSPQRRLPSPTAHSPPRLPSPRRAADDPPAPAAAAVAARSPPRQAARRQPAAAAASASRRRGGRHAAAALVGAGGEAEEWDEQSLSMLREHVFAADPPRLLLDPHLRFVRLLGAVSVEGAPLRVMLPAPRAEELAAPGARVVVVALSADTFGAPAGWMERVVMEKLGPGGSDVAIEMRVRVNETDAPLPANWRLPTALQDAPRAAIPLDVTRVVAAAHAPAAAGAGGDDDSVLMLDVLFPGAEHLGDDPLWLGTLACVVVLDVGVGQVCAELQRSAPDARPPPSGAAGGEHSNGGAPGDEDGAAAAVALAATVESVDVRCPLTGLPLEVPCRGAACEHLQCVELSAFVTECCRSHVWLCPTCRRPMPPDAVRVDRALQAALQRARQQRDDVLRAQFSHATGMYSLQLKEKRMADVALLDDDFD